VSQNENDLKYNDAIYLFLFYILVFYVLNYYFNHNFKFNFISLDYIEYKKETRGVKLDQVSQVF
jgi:hypothetical protein